MIIELSRDGFFSAVAEKIKKTDTVLDIGCGIMPMKFFVPKIHILVEPFVDYVKMLQYKYSHLNHIIIINQNSLDFLPTVPSKSINSVFLLDVIEHMDKEKGKLVLKEMERIAKDQVVIFTPLGFEEQDCESEEVDGWGLKGTKFQQHRSGWYPEDFENGYDFYVCKDFHQINWKGENIEPFGCFFAIKNMSEIGDYAADLPENHDNAAKIMVQIQGNKEQHVENNYGQGFEELKNEILSLKTSFNDVAAKNCDNLDLLKDSIKEINEKFGVIVSNGQKTNEKLEMIMGDMKKINEKYTIKRLIKNIKKESCRLSSCVKKFLKTC